MPRSKVAVLRVDPERILDDIDRLLGLAEVERALAPTATTILKDNISWHFPFPGANTTPWQLEGTARALRSRGFTDQVCVQNKTVVTDAFKGEDLNGYVPIFKAYDIPVRYNFKPEDMTWSVYRPTAKMNVLDQIFPEGILIPDAFHGTNIVHLPTVKCVAGDTELTLGDGTVTTIRAVVEAQLRAANMVALEPDGAIHVPGTVELFAMDPDGAVRVRTATHFARSRRGSRRVVTVRTRSGRVLTATSDHRLFTASGWAEIGQLAPGDRLAIARRVGVAGRSQPLPQTHAAPTPAPIAARAGRAYSAAISQHIIDSYQHGQTATAIAAAVGVRWQVVQRRDFASVRAGLGLTQAATGKPSSVNSIEHGYTTPTPRVARYFVDVFAEHDRTGELAEPIARMRTLASEDLAWDHVESIVDVDGDIDLYDVTVPGAESFIANGIVAHNCHIYTTTTGAMKNAFGGLLNTKRHYTHSWIHATLVDLLAIQKEIHGGLFAVMDGTTAGDGPGPRTMRPVIKDVMLASADQVAIDAVAASMMGFDPMTIEYIRLADEQGLGHARREDIEIVGDEALADQRWGFSVGDNGASMIGDLMWFGPLKRFQKLFFHTPLVNLFVMGSEAYHDYYRWPLRDRKVFESWRATTHWGQLFDYYQSHGTLADAAATAPATGTAR